MTNALRPDPTGGRSPWWLAIAFGLLAMGVARRPARTVTADPNHTSSGRGVGNADRSGSTGTNADTPADIPARGWVDILKRIYANIDRDRVLAVAAGVTFYGLLALFPAIVALVSLYGLFADASTISDHLKALANVLPGGAIEIVNEQVKRLAAKGSSLSFGFIAGLVVALWSANSGMKAMFDALNVAYEETEKRSFIKLNAMSLALTLGAIAVLILALGAVVVIPIVLQLIPFGGLTTTLVSLLRWPILLVLIALGFAVLYRFGPSRTKPRWAWVSPGSAFATIAWLIGSALFSFYVSHFGSYNATYGSLGAAIGFMTWIWISTIIVMLGAELNAQMEHQTARDTTAGGNKPQGQRGARMADTVAR